MLQHLREYRRHLAGSVGSLLAVAWLSLALAPCLMISQAAAHEEAATVSHHGSALVDDIASCPHCDHAETACASTDHDQCRLPAAVVSNEPDSAKLLKAALPLPETSPFPEPPRTVALPEHPPARSPVTHPPYTQLYCRFRE